MWVFPSLNEPVAPEINAALASCRSLADQAVVLRTCLAKGWPAELLAKRLGVTEHIVNARALAAPKRTLTEVIPRYRSTVAPVVKEPRAKSRTASDTSATHQASSKAKPEPGATSSKKPASKAKQSDSAVLESSAQSKPKADTARTGATHKRWTSVVVGGVCVNGHVLDEESIGLRGPNNDYPYCRRCNAEKSRAYYQRKRRLSEHSGPSLYT